MDPVSPVRLSRLYEDVDWVEKARRTRRGKKKQDEYRPNGLAKGLRTRSLARTPSSPQNPKSDLKPAPSVC